MDYDTLASNDAIDTAMKSLKERGFLPEVVSLAAEAFSRIKEIIPAGASVMNGSSRTLEQIGFVDYLKEGRHGWNNLHDAILQEKDQAKQATLRKQSVLSDFYLGSAHAIAQTGEIVIASNSGSQLPHVVYTSPNLILVVGTQKITPDLEGAIARVKEYSFPLEDARMKEAGMGGSFISKLVILNREPPFMKRKAHVIFVQEKLGF
ncbi:MAG: lactate utilization protein [Candidatus Wildermuthbacteria bacterium]|nr:lactate utilization protein [Candidatus Wildermuthbacteria bacterium]